jgi:hypothetical protein
METSGQLHAPATFSLEEYSQRRLQKRITDTWTYLYK